MEPELPTLRRDAIAARLAAGQSLSSGALAREFDVSEDAVRRDLRALAALGLCRRVYGGALPVTPGSVPFAVRAGERAAEKQALARAAASTVVAGEFVFLDAGSTNCAIVDALPEDAELALATNSVEIAAAVLRRGDARLLLIGGAVDPVVGGCVDAAAIEAVLRLNIDRCFLGACALAADGGASAFERDDAAFKRTLLRRSRRTLVLATGEKLGGRAPHRICELDALDGVVVAADAPGEALAALRAGGARLVEAAP